MVRCLVRELGADINQSGKKGITSLCFATRAGNLRMVKCLAIELGADINQRGAEGTTPVFYAAFMGHVAVLQCLVEECNANVNRANTERYSLVYVAAQEGNLDVVQYLVKELGANVNLAAHDGTTPLMVAAERMQHKVVRYLLKHGADPQALDNNRDTAADISKSAGAPAEETTYLYARTYCGNPSCTNAGLKKCERCLQVYFCGSACIRAHWPVHKAECKAAAAKLRA
jgi:ankyrin repeat protein